MSSNYLTSENMSMIRRLLAEIRQRGSQPDPDRETATARFQNGTTTVDDLGKRLTRYAHQRTTMDRAIDRWDNEGGALKPSPNQDHVLRLETAMMPLRPPRDEADRRRINDTVGKRRRARDIHERNRLI